MNSFTVSCPSIDKFDPNLLYGSIWTRQRQTPRVQYLGNKIKY